MSKWITDRLPTKEDTDNNILSDEEHVWVWRKSRWDSQSHEQVFTDCWCDVEPGTPWAPIITLPPPEPYVKPKYSRSGYIVAEWPVGMWSVLCREGGGRNAYGIPTREAAERIAAIYEEVMP